MLWAALVAVAAASAVAAAPASAAVAISGGGAATCAITFKKPTDASGQLYCWGAGSRGRLGRNRAADPGVQMPILVSALKSDVTQVDLGQSHACAVLVDTSVRCWGANTIGQIGNGHADLKGTGGVIAQAGATKISGINFPSAPLVGQTVNVTTGDAYTYVPKGTTITKVDTGIGGGAPYTLTLNTPTLQGGSALEVTVVDTNPYTDQLVPVQVTGLTSGVTEVSAGYGHTCALLTTGRIQCWGDGAFGRLGVGSSVDYTYPVQVSGITSATDISAGYIHTCAVLADTTVRCWGSNRSGQLGDGTSTNRTTPVTVKAADPLGGPPTVLRGVAKVYGGYGHTCALMLDQTVDCWGSNQFTELGTPSITDSYTNVANPVPGLSGVVSLDTSYLHTCASTGAKKVFCWGHNTQGDTGIVNSSGKSDPTTPSPTQITTLADATAITTGNGYSCALLDKTGAATSGALSCWGFGGNGQLGNNSLGKSLVPVAVWGGPDIDIVPPPMPLITARPTAITRDHRARFTFASRDPMGTPVTFSYSVDGEPFKALPVGTAVVQLQKLKTGAHQFRVMAADIRGNMSTPAVYTWTIV